MTVTPGWYMALAALLFVIGASGILLRRNALVMFMSVELMLNAVNLTFVSAGRQLNVIDGQISVFFVMGFSSSPSDMSVCVYRPARKTLKSGFSNSADRPCRLWPWGASESASRPSCPRSRATDSFQSSSTVNWGSC